MPPPPFPTIASSTKKIGQSPTPVPSTGGTADIAALESVFSDWFAAPVILTSSGRTAMHLVLEEMGLRAYRNRATVPPFLSRCILNVVTIDAFPIQQPGGDAILFYHQYGLRQIVAPREKIVVEDIAHAFFETAKTGARKWPGLAAIFSLPKFFPTGGPGGGLVVSDEKLAARLRQRLARSRDADPPWEKWRRDVLVSASLGNKAAEPMIEPAYALLTEYPKPDAFALASLPCTRDVVAAIGAARKERLERFAARLGDLFPASLFDAKRELLPYALPCFAGDSQDKLAEEITSALNLDCRVYNIDVARNMYAPDYRPAMLLPCHQDMPLEMVDEVCRRIVAAQR